MGFQRVTRERQLRERGEVNIAQQYAQAGTSVGPSLVQLKFYEPCTQGPRLSHPMLEVVTSFMNINLWHDDKTSLQMEPEPTDFAANLRAPVLGMRDRSLSSASAVVSLQVFHLARLGRHLSLLTPKIKSSCLCLDGNRTTVPRMRKQTRVRDPAFSATGPRTLHSRPPLSRFQEIFHAIKTGRFPNRTQLARSIEVTTKTIQRDLDYMRYQLNLPIEFDYARGGYYFTKPMTDLPLFQLTESELVSIFVAQKALEAYKGTVFEQPLRAAFQKLQATTKNPNAAVSISWEDLDSGISFRHFDAYLPDAKVFSEIAEAIQNEEVVEFGYKKLGAKAYEKRTVEPWHLACVSGQWYLLGFDLNRKARRIFVLARMQTVSATVRGFSNPRPGDVEIQKLFQNSFQIWQSENTRLLQIVLAFSGRAAQLVRERNWHSSQRMQELADGNLELKLTLNSLEEIVPWVLSWGKECKVVSPVSLQKKVNSLRM
jgi:predicted DNA-binding transcriptional regulator YafY